MRQRSGSINRCLTLGLKSSNLPEPDRLPYISSPHPWPPSSRFQLPCVDTCNPIDCFVQSCITGTLVLIRKLWTKPGRCDTARSRQHLARTANPARPSTPCKCQQALFRSRIRFSKGIGSSKWQVALLDAVWPCCLCPPLPTTPPPRCVDRALRTPGPYAISRKCPWTCRPVRAIDSRFETTPTCAGLSLHHIIPDSTLSRDPDLPRSITTDRYLGDKCSLESGRTVVISALVGPLEGPREGVLGAHQRKAAEQERGLLGNGTINGYGSVEPSTIA